MRKLVLIGDIVDSKRIKNRATIQKKLEKLFAIINSDRRFLDSPFTITLGDEFQALYNSSDNVFSDIWKIIFALYPERVRFSIGLGKISTKINRLQAIGMDGPAFYHAREGMEELKGYSYLFNVRGYGITNLELIRQILFFVSHSIGKWKLTRIKIFNFLMEDTSIKVISQELKISDKAVYKNIDTAKMYIIMDIFKEIESYLNASIKKD